MFYTVQIKWKTPPVLTNGTSISNRTRLIEIVLGLKKKSSYNIDNHDQSIYCELSSNELYWVVLLLDRSYNVHSEQCIEFIWLFNIVWTLIPNNN